MRSFLPLVIALLGAAGLLEAQSPWPADPMTHQLGGVDRAHAPSCSSAVPRLTGDSLGPIHIGMTISEFRHACPRAIYTWDFGDEGNESPAAVVRLGGAVIVIGFHDTLNTSTVYGIKTRSRIPRTTEGFGVGTRLAVMAGRWGTPQGVEAECVPFAWFQKAPGLSFRLRPGIPWDCGMMGDNEKAVSQTLISSATVEEVIVYNSRESL
jgi:hypothetical protein